MLAMQVDVEFVVAHDRVAPLSDDLMLLIRERRSQFCTRALMCCDGIEGAMMKDDVCRRCKHCNAQHD